MVIFLLYIFLLILCVIFPEMTITTSKETIKLWTESILPSLLPFFIISKCILYNGGISVFSSLLKPLTKVLHLPENIAFPLSMSLLCGYQTGSRTVSDMKPANINLYANVCFCASPIFIIGTVGTSILKNTFSGYALYIIHICTLLIVSVLLNSKNNDSYVTDIKKQSLSTSVTESITAVLNICGYMILYNLIIKITTYFLPSELKTIVAGFLEFTQGIKQASILYTDSMPIISFFLSFGGLCVITQCISILKGVNKLTFIFYRLLSGLIAFTLCLVYKKTALYVPILITLTIIISAYILRRKNYYWLKSSKSCDI